MAACLFSCEHATCAVSETYRELFRGSEELVSSPQGWDPGALNLAQGFAMKFRTPLVHGELTRLLIDLSESGDRRWSHISSGMTDAARQKLVERYEGPYRAMLESRVAEGLQRSGSVIHLMIHTEQGEGGAVALEIPAEGSAAEKVAGLWQEKLQAEGLKTPLVRGELENGLAKDLLDRFSDGRYILMRLKVPLSFFLEGRPLRWETLKRMLISTLHQVVAGLQAPGEYTGSR